MDDVITMEEIGRVYEVTDGLGIDREALNIELGKEDPGGWTRAPGGMTRSEVIAVTLPLTTPLDDWLPSLEAGLREMVGGPQESSAGIGEPSAESSGGGA